MSHRLTAPEHPPDRDCSSRRRRGACGPRARRHSRSADGSSSPRRAEHHASARIWSTLATGGRARRVTQRRQQNGRSQSHACRDAGQVPRVVSGSSRGLPRCFATHTARSPPGRRAAHRPALFDRGRRADCMTTPRWGRDAQTHAAASVLATSQPRRLAQRGQQPVGSSPRSVRLSRSALAVDSTTRLPWTIRSRDAVSRSADHTSHVVRGTRQECQVVRSMP